MGKGVVSATSNYQVRALDRALDILDVFSLAAPELTLTAIAARVNLTKSTTTRLLAVLEGRGYLERSPVTDGYRIGVRAFEVGAIYIQTTSIETEARPILQRLARECNQTANLGVLSQGEIIHLAVVAPERPIHFSAVLGQREGAYCTGLGKALLAELDDRQLAELVERHGLVAHTGRTITTLDGLRAQLARVRASGYAIDDEESYAGLLCVAAPIRDATGRAVAALSISGPQAELGGDALPACIAAVTGAAREVSVRLGGGIRSAG